MQFLDIIKNMNTGAEQMAFILSIALVSIFFSAYKKCALEIEKEEMLECFLKD